MNVMLFTMVLWTWNVHDVANESHVRVFRELLRYACLFLATPVLLLLGGPLFAACQSAYQERRMTMDVLLTAGVVAAFAYSVASLLTDQADVYFEVPCMILVAATLGRTLEASAKIRANQLLSSLLNLLPDRVRRLSDDKVTEVPLTEVEPGDVVRVLAGERIPVDGIMISRHATVGEQIVTGESFPREKRSGEPVYGGTINLTGTADIRATNTADSGTIASLVEAVRDAATSKCRAIRLVDRWTEWLVPLVLILTSLTFFHNWPHGTGDAILASLSVVLIACPCAFGIATPLALWVAITMAGRQGVLFRDGDVLLQLAKVKSVAFDKTGTVTTGDVQTIGARYFGDDPAAIDTHARSVAEHSNHALALPLRRLRASSLTNDKRRSIVGQVIEHPGQGITCQVDGVATMLGSRQFARQLDLHIPPSFDLPDDPITTTQSTSDGVTPSQATTAEVCFAMGGRLLAIYRLDDTIRSEFRQVVTDLKERGLELAVLTGDLPDRAAEINRRMGVTAHGGLLPHDKLDHVRALPAPVAMVGDGVNDAIALAAADVGIAMDCGADVSRNASGICLLGNTLQNLPWAIDLACRTDATIKRNLFWALAYNVVGIGFAMSGALSPIVAAVAMLGSSLFVLTNSLGILWTTDRSLPSESSEPTVNDAAAISPEERDGNASFRVEQLGIQPSTEIPQEVEVV